MFSQSCPPSMSFPSEKLLRKRGLGGAGTAFVFKFVFMFVIMFMFVVVFKFVAVAARE